MNQRGTVLRVRLNPSEGHEQAGTRPAMVVSATFLNEHSSVLVVAPITSKKTDRVYPFEALLDHEACGLDVPSKVMLNQIRTVDKARIIGIFGIADARTMSSVDDAIRLTLGLSEL